MDSRQRSRGRPDDPFRWHRTVAIGLAAVYGIAALWAFWLVYATHQPVDFLSFWAAGRLTLGGHAPLAYNLIAHKLVEEGAAPIQGWLPFPYPPTFLIFVTPFGIPSFWAGFGLWVALTGVFYIWVVRKFAPLPFSLVQPAVLVNSWIGQTGFLITGLFASGLYVLRKGAFLGGALLGLISIKPQLGVLVPVALLASREWRAIAGAAATTIGLLTISCLLFGFGAFSAFWRALPHQLYINLAGQLQWNELASAFGAFRAIGIPQEMAMMLQIAIAFAAAAITWRAWALQLPTREATLAAATMLVSPYLLTYDSLLLVLPMGWFIENGRRPYAIVVVWLLCLLPIVSYSGMYKGPSTIPLAAIMCLWMLFKEEAPNGKAPDAKPPSGIGSKRANDPIDGIVPSKTDGQ